MPDALQDVNTKIYTEWLPALKEYEFAAGYCVEYYDDPRQYEKGTMDENYYCEIWIPVKKKQYINIFPKEKYYDILKKQPYYYAGYTKRNEWAG